MPDIKIKTVRDLKKIQKWMKASISTPPTQQSQKLKKQTQFYLTGNSRMSAKERFDIYVNDFWPRILDSLSEDFPKLKKLLGEGKFKTWVEKYIEKFPSTSFTLFHLGKNFPEFIKKYYRGKNTNSVLETVAFEWAQVKAYIALEAKKIEGSEANLPKLKIMLHPSITLLSYQNKPWIIYRYQNRVFEQKLNPHFSNLLKLIQETQTLSAAVQSLSKQLDEKMIKKILPEIQDWFTIAQSRGWLVLAKK
jgi:hypothetical protein